MKMLRSGAEILLMLLCVATFSSCAERRMDAPSGDTRHFEKKFTVAPGGSLVLKTDVGSVSVKGGSGSEVSVVADLRGRERDVNRFEISADQHGNDVEVRGEFKEKMSSWFHGFNNFDARFVVLVPHEYSVELRTSGGNVEVIALKGRVRGGTSGGDVTAQEVEGEVTMETSGGSIHAEKVTGPVKMKTSGGDVRAVSMTGDVDLRTSGGNVWVEGVDGKVEAHTSGGNVHVKVNGANKGIHAETSGGNIELTIAKDAGAELDLSTSGGGVTCDMPVTVSGRIKEDRIHGTLNGGGPSIYAHTSGGDVRVRPL